MGWDTIIDPVNEQQKPPSPKVETVEKPITPFGDRKIVLRPYQERGVQELRARIKAGKRRLIFYLPTGGGKCLQVGTLVLRYDGRIVPVEEVEHGDLLMGPDSEPRVASNPIVGHGDLYRIVPVRGQPWVCNEDHVLTLVHTETNKVIDIELKKYLQTSKWFKHCHKLFQPENGIDFEYSPEPIVPGYFLGIWLGDGTKSLKSGIGITKADQEIVEECEHVARAWGGSVNTDTYFQRCPTHRIVTPRGKPNHLLQIMRKMRVDERIPHAALVASRTYRSELFAGLIDTDGYAHNGSVEIMQKRKAYADGIAFLARSLGFRVFTSIKSVHGRDYYRMSISGDFLDIPTRIARKTCAPRRQVKTATRTGFKVEPIGKGLYAGFQLSGDGRFLLGDFTVTHNTEVAAAIIGMAREKHSRVGFVCNRIELVSQASARFHSAGILHGILQGANSRGTWNDVMVGSIQTIAKRGMEDMRLLIVDEAHGCAAAKTYHSLFERFKGIPIIGLTATPFSKGLGKTHAKIDGPLFEDIVVAATIPELIEQGYLIDVDIYGPSEPDLEGVRTVAGDYHEGELEKAVDKAHLIGDIVEHWQKLGRDGQTICFATSIAHSKHITERFKAAGVAAEHIDAYTKEDERRRVIDGFKAGTVRLISNCSVLAEGFDAPSAQVMIYARPTKSLVRWIQCAGRILRPYKGQTKALILDHSGTAKRLGFPTTELPLELDDGKPKKSSGERKVPLPTVCSKCDYLKPAGVHKCPMCGFEPERKHKAKEAGGDLVRLTKDGEDTSVTGTWSKPQKQQWYSGFLWYARHKNYSDGWVANKFREKFGVWPRGLAKIPSHPSGQILQHIRDSMRAYAQARRAEERARQQRQPWMFE